MHGLVVMDHVDTTTHRALQPQSFMVSGYCIWETVAMMYTKGLTSLKSVAVEVKSGFQGFPFPRRMASPLGYDVNVLPTSFWPFQVHSLYH